MNSLSENHPGAVAHRGRIVSVGDMGPDDLPTAAPGLIVQTVGGARVLIAGLTEDETRTVGLAFGEECTVLIRPHAASKILAEPAEPAPLQQVQAQITDDRLRELIGGELDSDDDAFINYGRKVAAEAAAMQPAKARLLVEALAILEHPDTSAETVSMAARHHALVAAIRKEVR